MAKSKGGVRNASSKPYGQRSAGDYSGWGAVQGEYPVQGGFLIAPTGQILDVMKIAGVTPSGTSNIEVYHGEAMRILGPIEGWHTDSYGGAAQAGWTTARLWGGLGSKGKRYVSIRVPGTANDPSQFRKAKRVLQGLLDLDAADYNGTVDLTFDYGNTYSGTSWNGTVNDMLDARSFNELSRGF